MEKISVIVPVYNVRDYLPKCIDSILNQDYGNLELILVDDGSTDGSASIIRDYAARDARITAIFQENRGVSAARNAGLKAASGTYVGFVDGDDWIEPDMYGFLIEKLEQHTADLACCNWARNFSDGREESHPVEGVRDILSAEEFVCHIFDRPRTVGGSNWNKVFRRQSITTFYDETITICEDNLFLLDNCCGVKKVYYCDKAFYHIYERANSASRSRNLNTTKIADVRRNLIVKADKIGKKARSAAEADYLDYLYALLMGAREETDESRAIREKMKRYLQENRRDIVLNSYVSWKLKLVYLKNSV